VTKVQEWTAAPTKSRLREISTRKKETKEERRKEERRRQQTTEHVGMHCMTIVMSL
jgi:hypothetical protein